MLVGCLVLIAVARVAYESKFVDFSELPLNEKYLLKSSKDIQFEHPFNLILFTVQFLSVSLFLFLVAQKYELFTSLTPLVGYIRIALVYVVFVSLKFFTERTLGVLFKGENQFNTYQFYKLSYRSYFAFLLLPVNALFVYAVEPSLLVYKIIIGFIFVFNLVSLFRTFRRYEKLIFNNLFYFILYLCALEIAPYFILYKLFSEVLR